MSWFLLARHPSSSSHQFRLLLCMRFPSPVLPMSPDMLQFSHHQGSRTIVHLKVDAFRHRRLPPTHVSRGPVFVSNGSLQEALGVKNPLASAGNTGDAGSIPGLGRSPRGGVGNPRQYSCLENSSGGGTWWATVHGVAKSHMLLSAHTPALSNNPIEE